MLMKKITVFITQLIPVALGVYLAILAGNWNENRKQQKDFDDFKVRLRQEIVANKEKIKNVQEYHKMLMDTTDYFLNNQNSVQQGAKFWKGYSSPTLSTNTFEIGKQTNLLNRFGITDLQSLYELYTDFKDYNKLNERALDKLDFSKVTGTEADRYGLLMNIHSVTVDYYYQELELVENTSKILNSW